MRMMLALLMFPTMLHPGLAPAMPAILPLKQFAIVKVVEGEASFYGRDHRGRKMANGERFDERNPALCACLDWPLETRLRVTRQDNNRSIMVVCSDRGPFWRRRVVDLSRAAAESLDFLKEGHIQVFVTEAL